MLNGDVMPNYYGTFQLNHSKNKENLSFFLRIDLPQGTY